MARIALIFFVASMVWAQDSVPSFIDTVSAPIPIQDSTAVEDPTFLDTALVTEAPATVESPTLTVQWIALDARNGNLLGNQALLIDGDTARTDAEGFLETQHPLKAGLLTVQLLSDSLALARDTFSLDINKEYVQFTLEAVARKAKSVVEAPKGKADMVVVARREPLHTRKEVSKIEVSRDEMREVAATQNDPLHVIRSLPGVTSQNDANSRPYVRGGDWHETRVFWNGVPVIQPFHATSLYSIFNMEAVESMTFYSGGFPVEGSNSLSGAILLKSRPVSLDSFAAWTSLSMLKGHAWVGGPIIKDRLGVSLAYQSFWYDWTIKRGLGLMSYVANSKEFDEEVDKYQEFTDLPNFKDFELSANLAITPTMRLDYTWIRALDIFRVVVPQEYDDFYEPTDPWSSSSSASSSSNGSPLDSYLEMDTIALVEIPNHVHGLNFRWNINSHWDMLTTLAYQSQSWKVQFGNTNLGDEPIFDFDRASWHGRVLNLYRLNDKHFLNFGFMGDYDRIKYDVNLPRLAYEMIIQSNIDMMENIAFIAPEGMVITQDGAVRDLNSLFETVWMDYKGSVDRTQWGAWISDQWTLDSNNRIHMGTRVDYENAAKTLGTSPRVSWFHRLSPRQELTLGTGVYAQDNYEFYFRHLNPSLLPEKAWHFNAEWSMDLTPDYRIEVSNYAKRYWDLAAGHLVPTGLIDEYQAQEALENMYGMDYMDMYDQILDFDSTGRLSVDNMRALVSAAQWDSVLRFYGQSTLAFDNSAIGWALGTEVKLNYDPTKIWRGWLSVEASLSKRQDEVGGVWYNFRRHRPWAIKWHNYFDMPGDWEMSLRLEHSAGLVYTGYTDFSVFDLDDLEEERDTLFIIEQKNNRRYSSYTRFDIRLERNWKFFGHPAMTYFEIWNAFNTPNFILRDSETGYLKNVDLSYPFPIFFAGWEFRW